MSTYGGNGENHIGFTSIIVEVMAFAPTGLLPAQVSLVDGTLLMDQTQFLAITFAYHKYLGTACLSRLYAIPWVVSNLYHHSTEEWISSTQGTGLKLPARGP